MNKKEVEEINKRVEEIITELNGENFNLSDFFDNNELANFLGECFTRYIELYVIVQKRYPNFNDDDIKNFAKDIFNAVFYFPTEQARLAYLRESEVLLKDMSESKYLFNKSEATTKLFLCLLRDCFEYEKKHLLDSNSLIFTNVKATAEQKMKENRIILEIESRTK